jgi:hypothetical protein
MLSFSEVLDLNLDKQPPEILILYLYVPKLWHLFEECKPRLLLFLLSLVRVNRVEVDNRFYLQT